MPRGLFNWTFSDAESFLKENGFTLQYTNASHFYYVGHVGGELRTVCVPFHGKKSVKPRTMKGIILQSGIPQKKWLGR